MSADLPPRLRAAIDQLRDTRAYLRLYLDRTDPGTWYAMPPGCPTHIAWQVGHVAVACQFLIAGHAVGEAGISALPEGFVEIFSRGTVPSSATGPGPAELRRVLEAVHERMVAALPTLREEQLDAPSLRPHDLFRTRLEAVHWCVRHEMLHAGKIGLIRRMLGERAIR